jgi:hypothetical protein
VNEWQGSSTEKIGVIFLGPENGFLRSSRRKDGNLQNISLIPCCFLSEARYAWNPRAPPWFTLYSVYEPLPTTVLDGKLTVYGKMVLLETLNLTGKNGNNRRNRKNWRIIKLRRQILLVNLG